jgi:PKD repeat protein
MVTPPIKVMTRPDKIFVYFRAFCFVLMFTGLIFGFCSADESKTVMNTDVTIQVQDSDIPPLPQAFYGNLTLQGSPGPVSSEVKAVADGIITDVSGNPIATTISGQYGAPGFLEEKLIVQGTLEEGAPISFIVNDVQAEAFNGTTWVLTYPFTSGNVTRLDLRIPGTPISPIANFTGSPRSGNAPLEVHFTDLSTGVPLSWQWNFGDGSPNDTVRSPSHVYQHAGTFPVTLTVANTIGSDTVTKPGYITVSEVPGQGLTADFTSDQTAGFVPLFVQFSDLSTDSPNSWQWNFGDGTANETGQNPSHLFGQVGSYTVTLTVQNATGGVSSVSKANYIAVSPLPNPPVANFTANITSGVAPLFVQFNDTSSGDPYSWIWNFGDGSTSSDQNPVHKYRIQGNFTVSLTAANPGGSDTEQKDNFIQVESTSPVADFTANITSGPAPLTVQFTDTSIGGPTAWSWEFGDSGVSTEQDPVHRYEMPGSYTVNLTVSNIFGNDTLVRQEYITVTLPASPVADFSANPVSGFSPQYVQFTDLSTNNPTNWSWNFGGGATSNEKNPSHTFYQGVYTITLEVSNSAGSSNITRTNYITIYQSGGGGSGGGGGGGGGYTYPVETTPTPTPTPTIPGTGGLPVGPDGVTTQSVDVVSDDGMATLSIGEGVKLSCGNESLTNLIITRLPIESLPPVSNADIYIFAGYAYLITPDCGMFDPGATLKFTIAPSDWETLQNNDLILRWWDAMNTSWTNLPSTVDQANRTVSAPVTRAGTYALFQVAGATTPTTATPETTVPPTTSAPPGQIPWVYFVPLILIAIIAIMIGLYYWSRKRKPPEPGQPVYTEVMYEE